MQIVIDITDEGRDMTREEALEYGKRVIDLGLNDETQAFCEMAIKALEQESRTGHWIFDDKCKEHGHCSECGYGSIDLIDGKPHRFCPNCGAKMESEVENADSN